MKKILVIGSNSFSGSNFIDYLIKKKHLVFGISRSDESNKIFLKYKSNKNYKKYFKFFKINIKEYKKIINLIKIYKIEYIINYASQGMVAQSWIRPIDWYKTNILFQTKLVEEINKLNLIKRYLNFTTPEVYGSNKNFIAESFKFNPTTPYANSRAAFDFHLKNMHKIYNFPILFTRAANVYGQHQQIYRVIPRSILFFILNKKFYLDGGGLSKRSFIHIDDVSNATYKVLFNGKVGETYHISTNNIIKIKDLVYEIAKILNKDFNKNVEYTDERLGKDHSYLLKSNKIRDELNWSEKISLKDGLSQTNKWIKNNINFISKMELNYIHKK